MRIVQVLAEEDVSVDQDQPLIVHNDALADFSAPRVLGETQNQLYVPMAFIAPKDLRNQQPAPLASSAPWVLPLYSRMEWKWLLFGILTSSILLLLVKRRKEGFLDCPVGSYCPNGSQSPLPFPCPGGTYGSTGGLSSALCSGQCDAGCVCPRGSTKSCPQRCPPGYVCPKGTGGNTELTPCPAGNYCPEGSGAPTKCPAGTFGSMFNLATAACSGKCAPGFWCPEESIMNKQKVCKAGCVCEEGSTTECPAKCPRGSYCLPGTGPLGSGAPNSPIACPPGFFCPEGSVAPSPCPPGKFGDTFGLRDNNCTSFCQGGFYCPSPSSSITQKLCPAGNYCPAGSGAPIPCPTGRDLIRTDNVCDTINGKKTCRDVPIYRYYKPCGPGLAMYESYEAA